MTCCLPFTKMVRWVCTCTTNCSPAWQATPLTVWPVPALIKVASLGPEGTATVSGPGVPAGGWIQLAFMEAGMAWRGTCGFLNVGGTPVEPPPVNVRTRTTTNAMTATPPSPQSPTRSCFWRCSARRRSSARRWFSALRWAFDCDPLVIGRSAYRTSPSRWHRPAPAARPTRRRRHGLGRTIPGPRPPSTGRRPRTPP